MASMLQIVVWMPEEMAAALEVTTPVAKTEQTALPVMAAAPRGILLPVAMALPPAYTAPALEGTVPALQAKAAAPQATAPASEATGPALKVIATMILLAPLFFLLTCFSRANTSNL